MQTNFQKHLMWPATIPLEIEFYKEMESENTNYKKLALIHPPPFIFGNYEK